MGPDKYKYSIYVPRRDFFKLYHRMLMLGISAERWHRCQTFHPREMATPTGEQEEGRPRAKPKALSHGWDGVA